jgi:hypothetical protein
VAYTKEFIAARGGLINVQIGGRAIVIGYDSALDVVTAYFNDTGAPVDGVDVFGKTPNGTKLERVNTLKSDLFWFIFAEFYPQTDVNRV